MFIYSDHLVEERKALNEKLMKEDEEAAAK